MDTEVSYRNANPRLVL